MCAFHRQLPRPLGAIACLAAVLVYCQDKSSDIPGKPAGPQGEPTRTVIVNGVVEPVYRIYRGGTKGITVPRRTYSPPPDYSEEGRKRKIEGVVTLDIVVTSAGKTTQIRVLQGRGYGLDQKAIEAVSRWKFQPATKDGTPVSVEIAVEISFHLYQNR
jgi:TonB family protein